MTTPQQWRDRFQRREILNDVARFARAMLPAGYGFVLVVGEPGDRPGRDGAYVCNCDRPTGVKLLREMADTLERVDDFPHGTGPGL